MHIIGIGIKTIRGIETMKNIFWVVIILLALFSFVPAQSPYILVLGTAQDAGAPQMGCMSAFCRNAWNNRRLQKMVSSIALVDPATGGRWIFDATPDLPQQFQLLKKHTGDYSNKLSGIFLTHAHIGHYTGLMYLGRESINAESIPVYAMPRMRKMLSGNAPWSQLVDTNNILLKPLEDEALVRITETISVAPFLVPHRDEFSETVGYRIETYRRKFVFIPDIDKWQKWKTSIIDVISLNDFVFVDATFYADGEISRPISEVPHPFVTETVELLKSLSLKQRQKVYFIHFNHSNPLIQGDPEIVKKITGMGFRVTYEGQVVDL